MYRLKRRLDHNPRRFGPSCRRTVRTEAAFCQDAADFALAVEQFASAAKLGSTEAVVLMQASHNL